MKIKLTGNGVGELAIGEGAVRAVVERAVDDLGDGATKINQRLLLGSAMRVKEGKDKRLVVDLELHMPHNVFLPDAMRDVQVSVKKALAKHLGVENAVVNVSVTKLGAAEDAVTRLGAARDAVTKAATVQVTAAETAVTKVAAAGAAAAKAAATKVAAAGIAIKSS